MTKHEGSKIDNLVRSSKDAFSGWAIIKRVVLFFFFAVVLSIRTLVARMDAVGAAGGGFIQYIIAFGRATYDGGAVALKSLWPILKNPSIYIESSAWGSITVAVIMVIALIGLGFQIASLFLNIVDSKVGEAFGFVVRLTITIVLVIGLSCFIYYASDVDPVTQDLTLNETMLDVNMTLENVTIQDNLTDSFQDSINIDLTGGS